MLDRSQIISSRIRTETQLLSGRNGFTAAFLAVQHIGGHVDRYPEDITETTILSLFAVIDDPAFIKKKQGYFLYREAASALARLSTHPARRFSRQLIGDLQQALITTDGVRHRAVSEALGSLPVTIRGPVLPAAEDREDTPRIRFHELLVRCGIESGIDFSAMEPEWKGRTLVLKISHGQRCCLKFIRPGEETPPLDLEARWMSFLNQPSGLSGLPVPVSISDQFVLCLSDVPDPVSGRASICPSLTAICYLAPDSYFHYPNEPDRFEDGTDSVVRIFGSNARQLGQLTAKGIIHTALVPLFHNRTQQTRRDDRGVYNWEQGGRLDQWLASSRYPNFSRSGLRDFEHLLPVTDSKTLRHYIGEHLLAFILVAGSFFRNRFPEQNGTGPDGSPYDLRALFDADLFTAMVETAVKEYYHGLTGLPFRQMDALLIPALIHHLIQVMGRDTDMGETLRVHDQEQMTHQEFTHFLMSRGLTALQIDRFEKGRSDIQLETGPHLGGFNQPISVPELIDFLFCYSALCVSDFYLMENGLKAGLN